MNIQPRNGNTLPPTTEGDLRSRATDVFEVARHVFVARLEAFALHSHHPGRAAVSALRADELVGARCYLTRDGLSGFAIQPDGELAGLFSFVRGRGAELVARAVRRGASWLQCYDLPGLMGLYYRAGFRLADCQPFDPSLAAAHWDPKLGTPDYLTLRRV